MVLNFKKKERHTSCIGTDRVAPAEISSPDSDSVSFITVSLDACWPVLAAADMASCGGAVMGNVRM